VAERDDRPVWGTVVNRGDARVEGVLVEVQNAALEEAPNTADLRRLVC
jgi:hypothetical protein